MFEDVPAVAIALFIAVIIIFVLLLTDWLWDKDIYDDDDDWPFI